MTFTYQVGREDLLSYFRHFYQTSQQGKQLRTKYVGSWTGLYLVVALLIWLYFRTWLAAGIAYGAALLLRFVTVARFDAQLEKTVRQLVDDPRVAATLGERRLMIGTDGFREITVVGESQTPWSKVTSIDVEPERIFVRTGGSAATIIAKTGFDGPVSFDTLPARLEELRNQHAAE